MQLTSLEVNKMQKTPKQYQPAHQQSREYGIPIYIRREFTAQKNNGLFGGSQHKKLEEIVMYV